MKRKSKYSHNGCKNCKSLSIKCNEAVPKCANCDRRGLSCEYKSNVFVYQPGKVSKRKRSLLKPSKTDGIAEIRPNTEPALDTMGSKINIAETNSFGIIDEVIDQMRLDFDIRTSKTTTGVELHNLECDEMNELYENGALLEVPGFVEYWVPYNKQRYLNLEEKLNGQTTDEIHYHENDPEILEYLFHILTESKLLYNFVLAPDEDHICVSEWFLYFSKKYSIVGLTLNSITSNLLDVKRAGNRWACILQRSMSATLKNISRRVGSCDSFPEMVCYLICIMFLFSERSASRLDVWRLHLKGAFAIVEKCDYLYSEISHDIDNMDYELKIAAKMYSWTKNWFVASETVACLSAPKGGAIEDIALARRYLSYISVDGREDRQTNDSNIGGFNLSKGYSQNLTPVFADIIEYMMRYKSTEGVSLSGSEGILHSVTVVESQLKLSQRLLDSILKVEEENFDFSNVVDYKKRATMKACNICYCSALRIFIHSVMLGKSIYGPDVQYYVQTIEEQLATIENIGIYGLCIHWPLFLAALCAPVNVQRTNLLNAIQAIADNRIYVARNTVERLQKCWSVIDCGGVIEEEDYDCVTL